MHTNTPCIKSEEESSERSFSLRRVGQFQSRPQNSFHALVEPCCEVEQKTLCFESLVAHPVRIGGRRTYRKWNIRRIFQTVGGIVDRLGKQVSLVGFESHNVQINQKQRFSRIALIALAIRLDVQSARRKASGILNRLGGASNLTFGQRQITAPWSRPACDV